ncbi:ABC transporter ATP-binding protein [Nesterenkonia sp. NBAIMH1]|uniref:ABC transporter ATP-binding protein n=1 Tax=Nesterenkonia sp. NBAIMH1 TaxID=2600320 RepID=UPI0011B56670|nr:ABC transporter ATP-binding protein [Nesterenkonia sp. NBAIMH1]
MAVRVRNLRRTYGTFAAVDDLSFEVPTGSVFAFLGANGAGKSTTIGCITTTLSPTSGQIEVAGQDVVRQAHQVRGAIGTVFQSSLLDPLLTVQENLVLRAGFYGLSRGESRRRVGELSELIGLESFLDRRYGRLSGGQKRRADIARALAHDPTVIFLDEPTAGLDPQSREQIWLAIGELQQTRGTTVFLTTHYMEETERADRVCIIDSGRIVAEGTPGELRAQHSTSLLTVRTEKPESVLAHCRDRAVQHSREGEDILIPVESSRQALELLGLLDIVDFEFRHGTMDDVFLAVTGRSEA